MIDLAPDPVLASVAGDSWRQAGGIALAFGLSSLIGLEREIRQKDAGLRTHALVGTGAALFLLVGKYGFGDVLTGGGIRLDPSRIAAGIVSGIGFIGGGLIFVRHDVVRGLTTAATVWATAAIGMAAGAGLLLIALVGTLAHFLVVLVFPAIERRLPLATAGDSVVHVRYRAREGIVRRMLGVCTSLGLAVRAVETRTSGGDSREVELRLAGGPAEAELAASLLELDGVLAVEVEEGDAAG
jgi:putative Mg2+ transporter-C (MgtC) family protein